MVASIVIVMLLILLHVMASTIEECYLQLVGILCSAADVFGVRLSAIAHINKSFVWAHYFSQLSVSNCRTVHLLLELLFVKFGYFSVSCPSQADITYAADSICIS